MQLVRAHNLSKSHGTQVLFEDVDFHIDEGDSIALLGPNGAGKTSLVRILLGEDGYEAGRLRRKEGLSIGYVPQESRFEPDETIENFIMRDIRGTEQSMRILETEMSSAQGGELERALARYQALTERFEHAGGWDALDRGEAVLHALGLDNPLEQPLESLSGGEVSLLAFARALIGRPDLLILDEPGNHLDYLGLAWLENFLASYPGAVLVVSHNRYMVDRVSRTVWYLEGGIFTQFDGTYSEFMLRRKQAAIIQQHEHQSSERRIAELRRRVKELQSIATASYNPKKTVMVQLAAAKRKLAEEIEADPGKAALETEAIRLDLSSGRRQGDIALQVRGFGRAFGDRVVLKDVSFEIRREEKVALVGPNGCGKTTLLEAIVSEGDWYGETIRVGPAYRVGYLKQKSLLADQSHTIEEEVRSWGALTREDAFQLVAGLRFGYEQMDKRLTSLSGGELKRLELARLTYAKADFLILDEPTNHMDILSRDAIEDALEAFAGTLLVVSHDRYFLDRLVDRVVDLDGGTVHEYDGNFSEFFRSKYPVLPRMGSRFQDRGRVRKRPFPNEVSPDAAELERRIESLEQEKSDLDRALTASYRDHRTEDGKELVKQIEKLQGKLDALYAEWGRQVGV